MDESAGGGFPAIESGAVGTYPDITFWVFGKAGHLVAAEAGGVDGAAVDVEIKEIAIIFIDTALRGAGPEDAGAVFEEGEDGVIRQAALPDEGMLMMDKGLVGGVEVIEAVFGTDPDAAVG